MTQSNFELDFSSVLASSVHDMKNSICMLIQSIEVIQQESQQLSNAAKDELARLNYESNRLNSNLLKLLSLYRVERNQFPVHIEQYAVADICQEVIRRTQFYCQQHHLSIEINQQDSNLLWYFDYDLILNLVNDAVSNALRYSSKHIYIYLYQQQDYLHIEIHDDGPGFPDFMLNNHQITMVQPALAISHTGLGIYFAKLIADAHINKGRRGQVTLSNNGHLGGGVLHLQLP